MAPISIVILLVTLELRHIAHTNWLTFFLYTGDALTLPLFRESLAQHQVWEPVVSSQLLLFPEAVLYALCSVVTSSVRASLVANAYLNVLLLYAGARFITPLVVPSAARRGAAAAVFIATVPSAIPGQEPSWDASLLSAPSPSPPASSLQPLVNPADFASGQCFGRIEAIRGQTGVGDFWISRPLDAYGSGDTHVIQVLPNLAPFVWLVNRGSFLHQRVTFVVIDERVRPPNGLVAADTQALGHPRAEYSCPGLSVYTYPRGTYGYSVLNRTLNSWINTWNL